MTRTKSYYQDKIEAMIGRYVYSMDVFAPNSKHPCIDIVYIDFKPMSVVRGMLEKEFPEVEFRKIEREFSNEMLANYLLNIIFYKTDNEGKDIKLLDGDKDEIHNIIEYVMDEMYDMDLTDRSWIEWDATASAFSTTRDSLYNKERDKERMDRKISQIMAESEKQEK